ncbi:MAG: hypothetical protein IT580_20970 [Verrucomicrobiales bacterium]|nr:hypothetical protein [Verrucomicrobiales bacterium]
MLEHLHPAGAAQGASEVILLSGKFDSWPVQTWISGTGVTLVCETNRGQVRFEVAQDAAVGPRLVRVYNVEGCSEPRFFVVGGGRERREIEPNDRFSAAQGVEECPVTFNGRLDKNGDVDSYRVRLAAGEALEARLDAFVLMSKVDAVLRLVDEQGRQLAWNHDAQAFDPVLRWRATEERSVIVQVFGFKYPADASIQLTGGEGCVYRLHLATSASGEDPLTQWAGPREVEPNDAAADTPMALPLTVVGEIAPAGDIDRYPVQLEAGDSLDLGLMAAGLGSPLDAWIALEDGAGKERWRVDDGEGTRDPVGNWKAPESGRFVVVVGSVTRQGGEAYRYRLSVSRGVPRVEASLSVSTLVLGAGATNELKVQWKRWHGHTNAAYLEVRDLPEGVTAPPVAAPAGDGEVVVKLVATAEAAAASGPVRVVCRETTAGPATEIPVPVVLVSRGENNGVPQGYSRLLIERWNDVWLTVTNATTSSNVVAATAAAAATK